MFSRYINSIHLILGKTYCSAFIKPNKNMFMSALNQTKMLKLKIKSVRTSVTVHHLYTKT